MYTNPKTPRDQKKVKIWKQGWCEIINVHIIAVRLWQYTFACSSKVVKMTAREFERSVNMLTSKAITAAADLGVAIDFCSTRFLLRRTASLPLAYTHSLCRRLSHGLIIVMQEGGFPSTHAVPGNQSPKKENQTNIKCTHGHNRTGGVLTARTNEWERMDWFNYVGQS